MEPKSYFENIQERATVLHDLAHLAACCATLARASCLCIARTICSSLAHEERLRYFGPAKSAGTSSRFRIKTEIRPQLNQIIQMHSIRAPGKDE